MEATASSRKVLALLRVLNDRSALEGAPMTAPQLIPVFIPALVVLLADAERRKGSPLTEPEVLEIRDKGACMMMQVEHAIALDEKRGYNDIDPERVWEQWQEARSQLAGQDPAE
jgi:hypothetical protein